MAASLFGERFVGMRTPAWHNLGTVLEDQVTAEEALRIGGITYQYVSAPMGYTLPDGTFVESSDRVMVLRTPTEDDPVFAPLGIVSDGYSYLQNDELARQLDFVAQTTGWQFETVGALGNGGTVFLTLKAGSRAVFGDEFEQYFIVSDGKATGRALQISVAPVRVVCMNTLLASDSAASVQVKIAHDSEVGANYDFWLKAISALEKNRDRVFEQLEAMAKRKITTEEALTIFAAAYPYPRKNDRARMAETLDASADPDLIASLQPGIDAWQKEVDWSDRFRNGALELYNRFNEGDEQGGKLPKVTLKKVQGSAYAALQAVTELADWGGKGTDFSSTLFGYKAQVKRRAYAAALSIS